jgi:hypothetical protein
LDKTGGREAQLAEDSHHRQPSVDHNSPAQTVAPLPHAVPVGKPFEAIFGVCRSSQYELIDRGEIESRLIGGVRGRRLIITQSWLDYLERQRLKEAAGEIGAASPNPRSRARAARPPDRPGTGSEHRPEMPQPRARKR